MEDKTLSAKILGNKMDQEKVNERKTEKPSQASKKVEEDGSIADEVKKLNPELQRLFELIDRTIIPLRSDVTKLLSVMKGSLNIKGR